MILTEDNQFFRTARFEVCVSIFFPKCFVSPPKVYTPLTHLISEAEIKKQYLKKLHFYSHNRFCPKSSHTKNPGKQNADAAGPLGDWLRKGVLMVSAGIFDFG